VKSAVGASNAPEAVEQDRRKQRAEEHDLREDRGVREDEVREDELDFAPFLLQDALGHLRSMKSAE
jgi:hypothetical protein